MNKPVKLGASLACANFRNLEGEIAQLSAAGVDFIHIDIMDGRFVPNFALNFGIMQLVKELTAIPQECHLMVEEPEQYIERTVRAGAEYLSIHVEASRHVQRALQQIRSRGAKSGVALNPATPLSSLDYILDDIDMITVMTVNPGFTGQKLVPAMVSKVKEVREMLSATSHDDVEIQVDGNVSFENIPVMVRAGATMLVGGTSSIFHKDYSIVDAVSAVREIVKGVEVS